MKRPLLIFMLFLMAGITVFAQAPQLLNYQGIARTATGTPIANAPIGLRLTIHDLSAVGSVVYQETQTANTNSFGLYNVSIGSGTPISGTIGSVAWGSGSKFMQIEIDPTGGNNYAGGGTSQLLSVPYALYAANASLPNVGTAGTYGSATLVPVITTDPQGRVSSVTTAAIPPSVTSTGTTNYVAKFTSNTSVGNSLAFDNGATMGVNTITPTNMAKLHVVGVGTYSVTPYYQAGIVADGSATMGSASGVYGESGWRGVYGRNPGTATGSQAIGVHGKCEGGSYILGGYGVLGESFGTGPTNYGVYGNASGATSNNYGVYGTNTGTGYAGYFAGNLHITGTLSKGSGTFEIDHPLDPENKYLYHSFVESPDMMNIYNGNVTTDASGKATITLPDYFEALNKEFRYQLTVIGDFAQAVVSQKVSHNQFKIKTNKPNVEVSWQITGVRHDKYAEAHPVVPEVEKEKQFKGYYLHAAEWGKPEDRSIDALTNPKAEPDNKPRLK